ncbi:ubiquitin carboxyl-hydrolase [Streptococcus cristatus]|uniref:ubiquitin carboxyl-hydrolase n=1 Tax=Streptococcus cristatus TaxID=45634 RepID=UPI0022842854|nr:ubiquitin carboxyl-hydrolase [Streptococcus cristatus]MCY7216837.1 ubiquitin carboxyl-hydrolase [Streptococcus cristatus]
MKISKLLMVVFIGFLGLGTFSACSQQRKTEQKEEVTLTTEEKKEVQKQEKNLALFLVNNYEGISKIEFLDVSSKEFAQSRSVFLKVNDNIRISSFLDDNYDNGYSLAYKKGEKTLTKKEKPTDFETLDGIEVIYNLGK